MRGEEKGEGDGLTGRRHGGLRVAGMLGVSKAVVELGRTSIAFAERLVEEDYGIEN